MYETGTYSSTADLFDVKMKNFLVANGWTINADTWPSYLAVSKGDCYVNIQWNQTSSTTSSYVGTVGIQNGNDAFGNAKLDHKIWYHISSGFNSTWSNQVNSPVNSTASSEPFGEFNCVQGPGVAYHFFSGGAEDPNYFQMVLETTDDHFMHFTFGEVDDKGFGYTPKAAFISSSVYAWWANNATYTSRDDVTSADPNHTGLLEGSGANEYQVHSGGAMTIPYTCPRDETRALSSYFLNIPPNSPGRQYPPMTVGYDTTKWLSDDNAEWSMFHWCLDMPPNAYSGVTPMFPFWVFIPEAGQTTPTSANLHYLGDIPNIRMISMKNRQPGDEIVFGGDTWVIFPMRKIFDGWRIPELDVVASPAINNTSHFFGYAYKKIV